MKKLLCILLFLFPMIAYSQSHSEWVRQSAEQQVREYYQSKLNTKKSELRDAQNELVRLSNLPESEFHNNVDVKEQGVSLGVRIEALKAEIKMIEEEYNNKLGELRRIQQAAKSGQAQKTGQQKNAVRRKQSQSRQAAASRRDAEQNAADARRRREEAAARRTREEQARKVQFSKDKEAYLRDSAPRYEESRGSVVRKASSQAYGQMAAAADGCHMQKTLNGVIASRTSDKQMTNSDAFDKLHRNRGKAGVAVHTVNQLESTRLFEQKLAVRAAAEEGRYDKNWHLEQKKEALSIWLKSDTKMQELSKDVLQQKLENGIKTESINAQRDETSFRNARTKPERDAALQRLYGGIVSDRKYMEPHFLSQLDASGQSRIIDVLVEKCKDTGGRISSDMLKKVVGKVDYAFSNGKDPAGSDDVTIRAKEVLDAFHAMCANGLCNK